MYLLTQLLIITVITMTGSFLLAGLILFVKDLIKDFKERI